MNTKASHTELTKLAVTLFRDPEFRAYVEFGWHHPDHYPGAPATSKDLWDECWSQARYELNGQAMKDECQDLCPGIGVPVYR